MRDTIPQTLRSWGLLIGAILQGIGIAVGGIVTIIKLLLDSILNSGKPKAEIHLTQSEAKLNEAKADSIEFQDELSLIQWVQKLLHDGLALEKLLEKKNDKIAELEDEVFSQAIKIKNQAADIDGYERQKLGVIGTKRLEQAGEEKTGSNG